MQEIGTGDCIQLADKNRVLRYIDEKLEDALVMVGLYLSKQVYRRTNGPLA
jgi:hypothetical protein